MYLKKGWFILMRGKAVCELCAIVRLNTFNREGKRFDKEIHELGRGIGILLLKCLHKTPSGILINGRILEELFSNNLTIFQTGRRNKLDIYLHTLSRIDHLFIRLRDIFGIWWVYSHKALFFEESV